MGFAAQRVADVAGAAVEAGRYEHEVRAEGAQRRQYALREGGAPPATGGGERGRGHAHVDMERGGDVSCRHWMEQPSAYPGLSQMGAGACSLHVGCGVATACVTRDTLRHSSLPAPKVLARGDDAALPARPAEALAAASGPLRRHMGGTGTLIAL